MHVVSFCQKRDDGRRARDVASIAISYRILLLFAAGLIQPSRDSGEPG